METPLLGFGQNLLHQLSIFPDVQLKDLGPVVQFSNLSDARSGQGAQAVKRAVMGGGSGGGGLAFPMKHPVASGGAAEEGQLDVLPEDLGAEIQRRLESGENVEVHL